MDSMGWEEEEKDHHPEDSYEMDWTGWEEEGHHLQQYHNHSGKETSQFFQLFDLSLMGFFPI